MTSDDTCVICGKPANSRFFWDGRSHCSSACKWKDMWTKACSIPGVRPIMMNAWNEVKMIVRVRQDYKCAICQKELPYSKQEFHHVIPLFLGGNSLPENVILLCHDCHQDLHHGINRKFKPKIVESNDGFTQMKLFEEGD